MNFPIPMWEVTVLLLQPPWGCTWVSYAHFLPCNVPMSHRRHLPPAIYNYFLPVPKIFMDASKRNIHFLPLLSVCSQDDNTARPLEERGFKFLWGYLLFQVQPRQCSLFTRECQKDVQHIVSNTHLEERQLRLKLWKDPQGLEQPSHKMGPTNTPKHLVI